ncbi:acyltransferase [Flavobacterium sp. KACC 22758]|jgi:peptidoglycan/LPS O-acetylase OafA/YrhL|uniref:acyltransferase family protein n=1 Tax=Flavobacterium sp. KACC 22758 TaxID=3025667 RepID=UPI002366126C|nr:acyltransferase [Flavobacterium sp. KACC 22758]WDF59091.1 acyltransferase [Flavobacterium sp. KACC 22758]
MRINQLTFTRFLAAISIVIFHYGKKSFIFNNNIVSFIFFNANVCVSYFFVLSGFVMMIAYGNKSVFSVKDYFRNRFARIYPLYFFAILLVLFLQIRTKNLDLLGLFLNVLMIQTWIPGQALMFNPPGWSLSVEFLFYAIFPLVLNMFVKNDNFKKNTIVIILFWILSQVLFQTLFAFYEENESSSMRDLLMYNPLMHINEFLIGNLAGYFFIKKIQDKRSNYDFPVLVIIGLVFLALKLPLNLNFHNGLLAVLFIPLIILISLNNGFITTLFQKKAFVFLGEISFGIYILQFPVYSLISAFSINKYLHLNDPTIVFFLRLVILIILSSFTYIYIEKPLGNKIRARKRTLIIENPA